VKWCGGPAGSLKTCSRWKREPVQSYPAIVNNKGRANDGA
jgi:hypothetical protein